MSRMMFVDLEKIPYQEIAPGVRIRAPYGEKIMLSLLEMEEGTEVPLHDHPHEQAGMLLEGRMKLTIGGETRIVEPGSSYFIPPNVAHGAIAFDGPVKTLDVFSPIREDYAKWRKE